MSQRIFRDNGYEVLTGWDRPLQYFFLVIDQGDATVFSNLDRRNNPGGPGMSLEAIFAQLRQRNINPPETLRTDLETDRRDNAGNLRHDYGNT